MPVPNTFDLHCSTLDIHRNDASSMMDSPSSSVGSLDPASPRFRANEHSDTGNFYVTMVPMNPNAKVSVSSG